MSSVSHPKEGDNEGQSSDAHPGPSRGKEANGRSPAQEMGQLSPFSQSSVPSLPTERIAIGGVVCAVLYSILQIRQ